MNRIDIAALARRRGIRRKAVKLRPIEASRRAERELTSTLNTIITAAGEFARRDVMLAFESYRSAVVRDAAVRDAPWDWPRSLFAALRSLVDRLTGAAEGMADRIFEAEGERHTERFIGTVRAAIGIDMRQVIGSGDIAEAVALRAAQNAALIRSLGADVVKRVETATLQAITEGSTAKQLEAKFRDELGITSRRAKLIARDQTAKLTSDLNRIRQEQAGVTTYQYSTSKDERVRTLHRQHDGKIFRWKGDPQPSDGPPGTAINCRCVAIAIIEID